MNTLGLFFYDSPIGLGFFMVGCNGVFITLYFLFLGVAFSCCTTQNMQASCNVLSITLTVSYYVKVISVICFVRSALSCSMRSLLYYSIRDFGYYCRGWYDMNE